MNDDMAANGDEQSPMSSNFIYIINFSGITHVLKASDKKAAGYLDLARLVENDLATVRDLFADKRPLLTTDKQERIRENIHDVSFALKRTVNLLKHARVEQATDESIQVNTKNPWVLDSNDPKAGATFGRLQIVYQKLRTVIYDLEHAQAAAQLESPEMPSTSRRHSQNSSAAHMSTHQIEAWRRQTNARSVTSVSTLSLTPAPGDPLDRSFAQSYSSAISDVDYRLSVGLPSNQLGNNLVEEPSSINSTVLAEDILNDKRSERLPSIAENESAITKAQIADSLVAVTPSTPTSSSNLESHESTVPSRKGSVSIQEPLMKPASKVDDGDEMDPVVTRTQEQSQEQRAADLRVKSYLEFRKHVQATRGQQQGISLQGKHVGISPSIASTSAGEPVFDERNSPELEMVPGPIGNMPAARSGNITPVAKVQAPFPENNGSQTTAYERTSKPVIGGHSQALPLMTIPNLQRPGATLEFASCSTSGELKNAVSAAADLSSAAAETHQRTASDDPSTTQTDLPFALRVAHTKSKTMSQFELRSHTAPLQSSKLIPPYPVSEAESEQRDMEALDNKIRGKGNRDMRPATVPPAPNTRSTYPMPTVRDSNRFDSNGSSVTIPQVCITRPSLSVSRKPIPLRAPVSQALQTLVPTSKTISARESQISLNDDAYCERTLEQVPPEDDQSHARQNLGDSVSVEKSEATAFDGPPYPTLAGDDDAESQSPLKSFRTSVPQYGQNIDQNLTPYPMHEQTMTSEQPARSSRFRDADMNRKFNHNLQQSVTSPSASASGTRSITKHNENFIVQTSGGDATAYDRQSRFLDTNPRQASPSGLKNTPTLHVPQLATPSQPQLARPLQHVRSQGQLPSQVQTPSHLQQVASQPLLTEIANRQEHQAQLQSFVTVPAGTVTPVMHRPSSSSHSIPTMSTIAQMTKPTGDDTRHRLHVQNASLSINTARPIQQIPQTQGQRPALYPQSNGLTRPMAVANPMPLPEQLHRHGECSHHSTPNTTHPPANPPLRDNAPRPDLFSNHKRDLSEQYIVHQRTGLPSQSSHQRQPSPVPPPKTLMHSPNASSPSALYSGTPTMRSPATTTTTLSHSSQPSIFSPIRTSTTTSSSLDPSLPYTEDVAIMSGARSVRTSTLIDDNDNDDTPPLPSPPPHVRIPVDPHSPTSPAEKDSTKKRSSWAKIKSARQAFKSLELRRGMDKDRGGARIIKMPSTEEEI